jgi:hypothetical protein
MNCVSVTNFHTDDLHWKNGRYSSFMAYSKSKLANVLFSAELARRLEGNFTTKSIFWQLIFSLENIVIYIIRTKHLVSCTLQWLNSTVSKTYLVWTGTGVTTYSLHPGVVVTEAARHSNTTLFPGAKWLIENVLAFFVKNCEQGAQTTIYCAVSEEAGKETGLYYRLDLSLAVFDRDLIVLQVIFMYHNNVTNLIHFHFHNHFIVS